MSSFYDFKALEVELDKAVIQSFNILTGNNLEDINEVKDKIKNELLINPDSYIDYKSISFDVSSQLLSTSTANDIEGFCLVFLSSTFLLEKYLLICDEDESKLNSISLVINSFMKKIKETCVYEDK